ncbi:hypothetical protein CERSUDRAFT_121944 [Gelatoporia subvermispora B]|uniref:F-box domain-containing protein n=1 Tax=Ceriporiopsis subvermispora (strain B) TaxID=914234 RepID=M2RMQ7_CERS8|nr:hypothetical protein CERSUDRAFT_121944 [Gelatoporia subvermispora B]
MIELPDTIDRGQNLLSRQLNPQVCPRLPPELCDRVIDEVIQSGCYYGSQTPSMLSLVCRSWLPRVRYHRWRRIEGVDTWVRVRSLLALFRMLPDIPVYVRDFDLVVNSMDMPTAEDYLVFYDDITISDNTLFAEDVFVDNADDSEDLASMVRTEASTTALLEALFSRLVRLEHLYMQGGYLVPRIFRYLPRLRSLGFVEVCLATWGDLRQTMHILPNLQRLFICRALWEESAMNHPPIYLSDIPYQLKEVILIATPDLLSNFHKVFLSGTSRSAVIDLDIGPTDWSDDIHEESEHITLFMCTSHDLYDDGELPQEDAAFLTKLDPSIQLHTVRITIDEVEDDQFTPIQHWLNQITHECKALIITIATPSVVELEGDGWTRLAHLLSSSKFSELVQLTVRFMPARKESPPAELLESKLKHGLWYHQRNGTLRLQVSRVESGTNIIWGPLQSSNEDQRVIES